MNQSLLLEVIKLLRLKKYTLTIAESCTGGFLSSSFTSISGASTFFKGSFITYSNESKTNFLNISQQDIMNYGVVSQQIVESMATSIRNSHNSDFGLATTGYLDYGNDLSGNNNDLGAWISVSSDKSLVSKYIVLDGNRLSNIHEVSNSIMHLLRKEII